MNAFEVFRWFLKAAHAGFHRAQYFVALRLIYGNGVGKNERDALIWLKRAANQHYWEAIYYLADCFEKGDRLDRLSLFQARLHFA